MGRRASRTFAAGNEPRIPLSRGTSHEQHNHNNHGATKTLRLLARLAHSPTTRKDTYEGDHAKRKRLGSRISPAIRAFNP